MTEVWLKIKKYPYYEASNLGNIRSINRVVMRCGFQLNRTGVILTPTLNDNGYYIVSLYNKKTNRHERVHRLVASTFIENMQKKKTVNHKNGVKTDNRVENLEWATHSENHKHAYANNLMKPAHLGKSGEDSLKFKNVSQYTKNGEYIKTFHSARVADAETGVSYKHISCVCNGKRKTTGGYIWAFKHTETA